MAHYDGFISYSHAADGRFAPALQQGLQRLARPWHRRRALHVFRDTTGLTANPGLWSSITAALEDSEHFILLASPDAASSAWVNREVAWWRDHKDASSLLTVLTDGEWCWDERAGDFDWSRCTAVPEALRGVFTEEPRHLDMRWARSETDLDLRNSRFRDQVAELAAPLHHVAKDELEGEDVRIHRRARRLAAAAVLLLAVLTVSSFGTAALAARNADQARRNEDRAVEAQREADANAAEADEQRRQADEQRRQAVENAEEADANAAEADAQRSQADANAAEAEAQRSQADQNAAEAEAERSRAEASASEAEASAAEAEASAAEAEASAAEAEAQRSQAEASATEADAQRSQAEASAAEAEAQRRQAVAAEDAARREAARAMLAEAATRQANADLSTSNAALEQAVADLENANQDLASANADLGSAGLAAAALAEPWSDLALLLGVEAVRTASGDSLPARSALFSVLQETDAGLVDLLPPAEGQRIPADLAELAASIAGGDEPRPLAVDPEGRYAASAATTAGIHVWDLTDPEAPPSLLSIGEGLLPFEVAVAPGSGALVARTLSTSLDASLEVGLHVWNPSGDLVATFAGSEVDYELAPDGRTMAVQLSAASCVDPAPGPCAGPLQPMVVLVDLVTGGELGSWPAVAAGRLDGSTFSPDGSGVLLLDLALGAWVLRDVAAPAASVELFVPELLAPPIVMPGGRGVLAADRPGRLVVLDPRTGAVEVEIPWAGPPPRVLAVSPDGELVAVLAGEAVTQLNLDDGSVSAAVPVDRCTGSLRFSPGGSWVVAEPASFLDVDGCFFARTDDPISLIATGADRATLTARGALRGFGAFELLAWIETRGTVEAYALFDSAEPTQRVLVHEGAGLQLGPDGAAHWLAPAGVEAVVLFEDPVRLGGSSAIEVAVPGPDGRVLGLGQNGVLHVWDLDELGAGDRTEVVVPSCAQLGCPPGFEEWVPSSAFDPGGGRIAWFTGGAAFCPTPGSCPPAVPPRLVVQTLDGALTEVPIPAEVTEVRAVTWLADGARLALDTEVGAVVVAVDGSGTTATVPGQVAAASADGSVVVTRDLETDPDVAVVRDGPGLGEVRRLSIAGEFPAVPRCGVFAGTSSAEDLVLSVDDAGRVLAVTDGARLVLWDLRTGEVRRRIDIGTCGGGADVAAAPDGSRVLTTRVGARTVDLWSTDTGDRLATQYLAPTADEDLFSSVALDAAFDPAGDLVLVAGRLLDGQTLERIGRPLFTPYAVGGITDDGLQVLAFEGSTVTSFALDPEVLVARACELAGRELTDLERLRFAIESDSTCPS